MGTIDLTVDELERTAEYRIDGVGDPTDAIIFLHGAGDPPFEMLGKAHLANKVMWITPKALPWENGSHMWIVPALSGKPSYPDGVPSDTDYRFILNALMDYITDNHTSIERVFLIGHSAGALFVGEAYGVRDDWGGKPDGYSLCAYALHEDWTVPASGAVPCLTWYATEDPMYDGTGPWLSMPDTIAKLKTAHGASAGSSTAQRPCCVPGQLAKAETPDSWTVPYVSVVHHGAGHSCPSCGPQRTGCWYSKFVTGFFKTHAGLGS